MNEAARDLYVSRLARPCARLAGNLLLAVVVTIGTVAALSYARLAHAGAQKEEFLANAVRGALSAAIADDRPRRVSFAAPSDHASYQKWLTAMSTRLEKRIPEAHARLELLETVYYESKRAGLEPSLVLGLIQVESNFRKYAISSAGARGLMQVMPFWTRTIGDGDERKLFHLQSNLRYGCTILRHYIDREGGNLFLALGRYNGSRGRAEYPNLVHAAWQRWHYAESLPTLTAANVSGLSGERASTGSMAVAIPAVASTKGARDTTRTEVSAIAGTTLPHTPAAAATLDNPFATGRVSELR
jgi:soluble lytic murein transglycosylase-like protein